MKIIESNKLIAEFMGIKFVDTAKGKRGLFKNEYQFEKNLKFHTSWDWLMPVVEKIGAMGYSYDINPVCTNIGNYALRYTYSESGPNTLENTYNSVVKFINWYNSNKLNHEQ